MNSTSLEEACLWMGSALGLNPVKDRSEVVSYVNKYRNLLYNSFNRVQLFDDYEQCFAISTFRQNCSGSACSTYRGFTATLDMGGVMGSWESLKAVTIRSRWREVHRGKDDLRGRVLEIIPMNGSFATERDMTSTQQLRLYAHSKEDAGKSVFVVARGEDGTEHNLQFVLGKDTQVTVNRAVCSVLAVTMPADLCGSVGMYQDDGLLLSVYPPGVRTPQYRRYKVHDGFTCESSTILIQSARVYIPVTEDYDVIEVGDQLVIESAGRFFKYGENTLDPKERKAALGYREEMYGYIDNIMDRDRGRESNDSLVNFTKKPRRSRRRGLTGYRR
jgi:hypothetical protein|tara:strand:- start:5087 stop:6079 length:993 start_codon:yes stop_codon:yes gene_type:complete